MGVAANAVYAIAMLTGLHWPRKTHWQTLICACFQFTPAVVPGIT